jgi:hypothetical protein
MPNKHTFQIKPIKELIQKHWRSTDNWIDPFCGESVLAGKYSNDLKFGKDADTFIQEMYSQKIVFDGAFFDPPYSPRQIKECYQSVGLKEYNTKINFYSDTKNLLKNVIRLGGKVLSFGWNSNGMGKSRGFEIIEILLVPHGSAHNDTICTVEVKINDEV